MALFGKKTAIDMTQGSIASVLYRFSIPIFVSSLFSILYSTVDAWVVGNFVGTEAYSSIGTLGPILNIFIAASAGLYTGITVVIAQYIGAKNEEKVQSAVHTSMVLSIWLGVATMILGNLLTPLMLRLIKVPDEVFPFSETYLRIYFLGSIPRMVGGKSMGSLRAAGEARLPLYFETAAALMNIVLDLVFVLDFGMGVAGVAIATILSETLSAVLSTGALMRTKTMIHLSIRKLHIDRKILKPVIRLAIPNMLQTAIVSFSNVFVQGYINNYGTYWMSGYATYCKCDQIISAVIGAFATTISVYVGQNLGKGDAKRVRHGVRKANIHCMLIVAGLSALVVIFARPLSAFFDPNDEAVKCGVSMLSMLIPFQTVYSIAYITQAATRGAGDTRTPMMQILGCYVVFRQVYLFAVAHLLPDNIFAIVLSYPAGWLLCGIVALICYHRLPIERARLVQDSEVKKEVSDV